MKRINIKKYALYFLLLSTLSLTIYSCQKDDPEDEIDPNKIELSSFGPSPVLRGGELQFIGRNLDKVTEIVLPDNVSVTNFNSKAATKITLTVPEATVDGKVTLKTPQGDIVSKSLLTISEPIVITSITPAEARPGEKITISGTYLNLIGEVIFKDAKVVLKDAFISQTQTALEVYVPLDAQTGSIVISNAMEDPILVSSETDFVVTLPVLSGLAPQTVKAGAELTISGSDLDLVKELIFPGNHKVSEFTAQSATEIKVIVPEAAEDGEIKGVVASTVEVASTSPVTMVVPVISTIAPDPAKPGTDVTITGTDLDLVTSITFGGDLAGTIVSKKIDELVATLPLETIEGNVTLGTAAGKSVSSAAPLALIAPTITSISPEAIKANEDLTILGTDLDLVSSVSFEGGNAASPSLVSNEEITVTVPSGTLTGIISLATMNGTVISSENELEIIASNVPTITEYPENAKPGTLITLIGEKLDLATDVIFPENVYATQFGIKTATMLQVVVPNDVKKGFGVITFITFEGESTTSPIINFQGVDPVQDESLVFFDFNGTGKDSWWGVINDGNVGGVENDEDLSIDGTSYARINGDLTDWNAFFFRNGANNFPGATVGSNINDYVLKFDINVLEPITGGEFLIRFRGDSDNDFFYSWAPWNDTGAYMTEGWITVTIPLSEMGCPDYSIIDEDFGIAFNSGSSVVNISLDNMRFERL
ncbi:glycan-binding surface protein [Portibacter lacus]|nr:glycan-binding surface protein [Portibacter lacus]